MTKIKNPYSKLALLVCALTLAIIAAVSWKALSGGTSAGSAGPTDSTTFSWFINNGVQSTFYVDYAENPGVQYWMGKEFAHGEDFSDEGEFGSVKVSFQVPPSGKATDVLGNMFATGNYPDIVDAAQLSMTPKEAYEAGYLMDLTPYLEECMPNYLAFLRKYDLEYKAGIEVDGQRRQLFLINFGDVDITSQFCGYMYRRDWIFRYGKNPATGESFTGEFTLDVNGNPIHAALEDYDPETVNGDSWVDDIVFPSYYRRDLDLAWYRDWCEENGVTWDGRHPVTISDWEWMLGIFKTALKAEGKAEGYVMSLYYPGYIDNGDMVTGFGGGGIQFYNTKDGHVGYGGASDRFRTYLTMMNKWYSRGWVDEDFYSKNTEMFYSIDNDLVRQGAVGCWMGVYSDLGTRIFNRDFFPQGVFVSSAAQPINDIYGTDEMKHGIPDTFFSHQEEYGGGTWITTKVRDKDIKLLLRALDWFYSEEGGLTRSVGLNTAQLEECPAAKAFYEAWGLPDGAYFETEKNGEPCIMRYPVLEKNPDLQNAACFDKGVGYSPKHSLRYDYTDTYISMLTQYIQYKPTGFISGFSGIELTDEENAEVSKMYNRIFVEYMPVQVPKFITGARDITDDDDWDEYCHDMQLRGYKKVLDMYNRYIDAMREERNGQ